MLKVPVDHYWWTLPWLNKPLAFVILLFVACLGIYWFLNSPQRVRWIRSPKGFLILFCITALIPVLAMGISQGLVAFLPKDSGKSVDAIVVVGRGWPLMHARVDAVNELWRAGRAPIIFASGHDDAPHLVQLLEEKGIPDRVLDGENCSMTTEENAIFSAAILQPRGVRKILLVTDKWHMLRSILVYRAYGFKVLPSISSSPEHWNTKERGFLKLREYAGVISYAFRGLFFPQNVSDLDTPELKDLVQQAIQYGRREKI